MNFRPFLCFAIFIAMGILSAYFFIFNKISYFIISISFSFVFIILFLIFSKIKFVHTLIFAVIFVVVFILGGIFFTCKLNNYKNSDIYDMNLTVTGRVKENTGNSESSTLILKDVSVSGAVNKNLSYNLIVYTSKTEFKIGDRIKFKAYIHDYHEEYSGKFSSGFISENIKYYTYIDNETIYLIESKQNIFEKVNGFIKDTLNDNMGEDEFSIAYSLLLGKSDYMDDDTLNSFRKTGVAHIFAVSGLHIGFLALALEFLLAKIKLKNPYRAILIILALFFYSGVCEFTASSIRACIMTTVLLLSRIKGKKYDVISSLSLAFTIILLISPVQLFCLGFQLSFGAVLGIVLFTNKLKRIFVKIKIPEKISNAVATSISAQIFTFLVMIKNFGGVSIISVFVNVLVVPLVGIIFIALFVCVIFGGIFSIANITLFIPSYMIKGIKYLVMFFDRKVFLITFAVVALSSVAYYSCVAVSCGLINFKIKFRNIMALFFAITFIIISIVYTSIDKSLTKITVTSNGSFYATVIEDEGEKYLIVNNITEKVSFTRLNKIIQNGDDIDGLILLCDNKKDEKLYNIISRFSAYFNVKKAYLEVSEDKKILFEKVFNRNELCYLDNTSTFSVGKIKGTIINNQAVILNKEKEKILVVSKIDGEVFDYKLFMENYDYLIVSDHLDNIKGAIKYQKIISYTNTLDVQSALSSGNITIKI